MGTQLLPELVSEVLEHLHSADWKHSFPMSCIAKETILSCSLVSRTWREVAQPHIFRDIVYSFCRPNGIGSLNDYEPQDTDPRFPGRFYQHVNTGESKPHKNLPMFVEFLQQTPQAARCVRRLLLVADAWSWPETLPDEDCLDPTLLSTLTKLLPQLNELWLVDVVVRNSLSFCAATHLPSLPLLTVAYSNYVAPTSSLVALLALFNKADTLNLKFRNLGCDTTSSTLQYVTPVPLETQTIWLSSSEDDVPKSLAAVLNYSLRLGRLRAINIMCSTPSHYQLTLDHLGPSIECLRFTLRHPRNQYDGTLDGPAGTLSITSCIALQKVVIVVFIRARFKELLRGVLQDIQDVLDVARITRGRYPQLQEFVFEVYFESLVDPRYDFEVVDPRGMGDKVDEALVQVIRQSAVEKIGFNWFVFNELMVKDGDYEEVQGFMSKLFPKLHEHQLTWFSGGRYPKWPDTN